MRGIRRPAGAVENMRRLGLVRPRDPSWCPVIPSFGSSPTAGRQRVLSWTASLVSSSHTWEARMWSAIAGAQPEHVKSSLLLKSHGELSRLVTTLSGVSNHIIQHTVQFRHRVLPGRGRHRSRPWFHSTTSTHQAAPAPGS